MITRSNEDNFQEGKQGSTWDSGNTWDNALVEWWSWSTTLQCQNLVPTRAFGTSLLPHACSKRPFLAPSFGTVAWCPRTSFLLVMPHGTTLNQNARTT
jgi:hypothetical protein